MTRIIPSRLEYAPSRSACVASIPKSAASWIRRVGQACGRSDEDAVAVLGEQVEGLFVGEGAVVGDPKAVPDGLLDAACSLGMAGQPHP